MATKKGGTSATASDQIWQYTDAKGWSKYFYYKRGTTEGWRKDGESKETEETLKSGTSFFFVRPSDSASSDTTITLAGGVTPLTDIKTYAVAKGETVMMANPWPIKIQIKHFNNYNQNPKGGTSATASDQIWRYDDEHEWRKYFFYKRGTTAQWRMIDTSSETEDVIGPGEGFFFVRPSDSAATATTIQFAGPEAVKAE